MSKANRKSLENGLERKMLVLNKLCSGKSALIFDSWSELFRRVSVSQYSNFSGHNALLECLLKFRLLGTGLRVSRPEAGVGRSPEFHF